MKRVFFHWASRPPAKKIIYFSKIVTFIFFNYVCTLFIFSAFCALLPGWKSPTCTVITPWCMVTTKLWQKRIQGPIPTIQVCNVHMYCFFLYGGLHIREDSSKSMESSSMFRVSAFGPGDLGSNPGWFAVSNSNWKLSFQEYYQHVVL